MDAYHDRAEDQETARLEGMVEAVRAGTIFARSSKDYKKWLSRRKRQAGQAVGLVGSALESAVRGFAAQHPEYVIVEKRST